MCVGFVGLILLVSIMLGVDIVIRAHNIQNKTLWGGGAGGGGICGIGTQHKFMISHSIFWFVEISSLERISYYVS